MTIEVIRDKREPLDRRRFTWKTVIYGLLNPRRHRARREEPDGYHVDFHDAKLWIPVVGIVLLSVADALLTIRLLSLGAVETNRVMADVVTGDGLGFAVAKMLGTAVGVVLLTAVANFKILGLVRVRSLIYVMFAGYMTLVAYELAFLLGLG